MTLVEDKTSFWKYKSYLCDAKPGDMIEFDRGWYSHWGIYIGQDTIVHKSGEDSDFEKPTDFKGSLPSVSGATFDKAKIIKSNIFKIMGSDGKARVNNYLDNKYKPLPVNDIVARAKRAIGQGGYNLLNANCEHFVTHCRYGEENSRQVQVVVGGMVVAGLALTGIGFAISLFKNSSQQKKNNTEPEFDH